MVLDRGFRCFSDIVGSITNKFVYAFSFLVGKRLEPKSINAKLFLPIILIRTVAYALTLLLDNFCRLSCIIVLFAWCNGCKNETNFIINLISPVLSSVSYELENWFSRLWCCYKWLVLRRYLKLSHSSLQSNVNNLGTKLLSICYSSLWRIPS